MVPLPCPVEVIFGIGGHAVPPAVIGNLLAWQQRADTKGRLSWWGLVGWWEPDGLDGWVGRLQWVHSPYLTQLRVERVPGRLALDP